MASQTRLTGVPLCGIPHGFQVSQASPGRLIVIVSQDGSGQFVAPAGKPP